MSTATKWLIGVVVLAAALWFLWSSGWLNKLVPQSAQQAATGTAQRNTPAPTLNGMSPSSDNSDAALTQDTAAIDAQMSAYATDSASVDSTANDTQLAQ